MHVRWRRRFLPIYDQFNCPWPGCLKQNGPTETDLLTPDMHFADRVGSQVDTPSDLMVRQ